MNAWPLLLADADLFKLILFVVLGLFALIKHVVDSNAKQRRPVVKPEVRPRPRPAAPAGRPEMPSDVNDFLRRAAEKRAAAQRPVRNEPEPPTRRLVTSKLDAPMGEVVDAQAVDDAQRATRVGAYVEQHLGTRQEAASHLTQVGRSEAAFEAHLQQTFQHHVGQFDSPSAGPAEPAAAIPVDVPLVELLADPGNLRQAIILNEILQRPVDRWQ